MGSVLTAVRASRACGGGVVTTTQAGTIGADAQRIFISVHGGMTDVITQIGVPATTADYGVLIPVPSEPTLDPTPVASAEIDTLDSWTTPSIMIRTSDGDGGGCHIGCGSGASKGGGSSVDGGAQVSMPVTIGPVTAVTLTADTGDAINAWLAQNGFAIPAADQSLVGLYAGPGRYFIAIRRSDTAATGGATSVGVHFTLAGDERGLPLRFARLGAGERVGFTVFVVADEVVGPAPPFTALTLHDLDPGILKANGYEAAVLDAVAGNSFHAFVIEGSWISADLSRLQIPSLRPFIPSGARLTRLSTLLPSIGLDADVVFDQPFTGPVPHQIYVQRTGAREENPQLAFGAALLAFAALARRRRR
jgi:uncharacterized protein DUF2330